MSLYLVPCKVTMTKHLGPCQVTTTRYIGHCQVTMISVKWSHLGQILNLKKIDLG